MEPDSEPRRRNSMKLGAMLTTTAMIVTGCAIGQQAGTSAPDLSVAHGCGFGFYLGDEAESAGLVLEYVDFEGAMRGEIVESSQLTDAVWSAGLEFGRDLFANWCDDVIEPGEPTPVIDDVWRVSGRIDVTMVPPAGECGAAAATATGLVARSSDGEEIALGDITLSNDSWGCFAG